MASGRTVCKIVTFLCGIEATLDHVMVVTADVHEIPSGVPRRLEQLGVRVLRKRLPTGDYIVGGGAVVERKSVLDLQNSLLKGRFWTQIGRLRRVATWSYLLVEGESLAQGPVEAEALRGLWLAVLDLGVIVLRADDSEETALWLRRLAIRRQRPSNRDRPRYAQRFERLRPQPSEAALAAAPGISVKTVRSLLEHFGSLHRVINAYPDDWQSVPGVGPHRSEALRHLVHDEWPNGSLTSHSDASRNGHHAT